MLPENTPSEWRKAFIATLKSPPSAPVQTTVVDKEELPYCGTLIAADATVMEAGLLQGPVPAYCIDYKLALRSLLKLTAYDIETVICYHGGIFNNNPNASIAELARTLA